MICAIEKANNTMWANGHAEAWYDKSHEMIRKIATMPENELNGQLFAELGRAVGHENLSCIDSFRFGVSCTR